MTAQSMFEKIWRAHEVVPESGETPAVLYVDLHLIHEVTSPQAFALLRSRGIRVRRPDRSLATLDHATPTDAQQIFGGVPIRLESAARQIAELERNAAESGIELLGLRDERRGIVHVIGPELGLTQPGMTIVCGDSHTSTHGAFGALAFAIGTTEIGHVLATQCLLQHKPKTLAVEVRGRLSRGVAAKDLVLAIIAKTGVAGGIGKVIEYRGEAIRALSMEERMTVCNMSIEAGARAGMVAPDETTFEYLRGRPRAPSAGDWDRSVAAWRRLPGDKDATFDQEISIDAAAVEPMVSYGTNPGMTIPIGGSIPVRDDETFLKALHYMGFAPGEALAGKPVDVVFIGSCTNSQAVGPAHRRGTAAGAQGRGGRAHVGRARLAAGEARGRGRGPARGIHRSRRGMARVRLLDVRRHQWRHGRRRTLRRQHQQPQFRGAPGPGRTHAAREPGNGRRRRDHRAHHRSTRTDGLTRPGPRIMQAIRRFRSRTIVLPASDIDTDQIFPARFLTTTSNEGHGQALFADWRFDAEGRPRPDFVLNRPDAAGCSILVAGGNFGCGSSREHAAWALHDHGIRAVISTSIADIFFNNAVKNGLLPILVDEDTHGWLLAHPGAEVDVDLEMTTVILPDGRRTGFSIGAFARHCLLNGIDELEYLRKQLPAIEAHEKALPRG